LENNGFVLSVIEPVDVNVRVDNDSLHLPEDLSDMSLTPTLPQSLVDLVFANDNSKRTIQSLCFRFRP
jgi:hypothetical protein